MENKVKNPTYAQAISELENIITQMESAEISIDDLSEKVKRASFLIKICREKLVSTEKEIGSVLNNLDALISGSEENAE